MMNPKVISYTNDERNAALNVSLTALASSLGYTPVRAGRHYYLKEMDSLVIYNDRSWNRCLILICIRIIFQINLC